MPTLPKQLSSLKALQALQAPTIHSQLQPTIPETSTDPSIPSPRSSTAPPTFIHGPPPNTPAPPPPGGNQPIQTPGLQNPGKVDPSYMLMPVGPTPFRPVPVTKASANEMPPYWFLTQTTLLKLASPAPLPPPAQTPTQTPVPVQSPNNGAPPMQNPNNAPASPATPPHSPVAPQATPTILPLPLLLPFTPVPTPAPALIFSNTPLTPNTPFNLPATTLSPVNGPPTTTGAQTILLSAGILHVGTLTAAFPVQTPAASPPNPLVLGGITFTPAAVPSAPAITAAPVVVAGATVSYIPGAGDVVIGTRTVLPGSVATISGTPVSLSPGGLGIGTAGGTVTTVVLPIGLGGTPAVGTGLGAVILSAFDGGAGGAAATGMAAGNATATIKPFVGQAGRGKARGMFGVGVGVMMAVGVAIC